MRILVAAALLAGTLLGSQQLEAQRFGWRPHWRPNVPSARAPSATRISQPRSRSPFRLTAERRRVEPDGGPELIAEALKLVMGIDSTRSPRRGIERARPSAPIVLDGRVHRFVTGHRTLPTPRQNRVTVRRESVLWPASARRTVAVRMGEKLGD